MQNTPISDYDKINNIIDSFFKENIIRTENQDNILIIDDVYQRLIKLEYFDQMTRDMHPKKSYLIKYLQKSELTYGITWFKDSITPDTLINCPDTLINCIYNTDSVKLKAKLNFLNQYYEFFINKTVIKTKDIRDTINIDLLYERFIKYQKPLYDNFFLTKEIFISWLHKLSIQIDDNGVNIIMARFIPCDFTAKIVDYDPNYIMNFGFTIFGKITVPIINFMSQVIFQTTNSRDQINLNLLHDEFISYHDKVWKKNHPDYLYLNSDIMIKHIFDPWLLANGYKIITENEGRFNEKKFITNAIYLTKPNATLEYNNYNALKIDLMSQLQRLTNDFLDMVKETRDNRDKIDIDLLYSRFKSFLHNKKGIYIDDFDNKQIDKQSFMKIISNKRIDADNRYILGVRFEPSEKYYYLGDYEYRVRDEYDIYKKYGSLHTLDVIDKMHENMVVDTLPIINFIAHNLIISEQVKDELDLNLIYERFNMWYYGTYEEYNTISIEIFTECLISNQYNISGQIITNARYEPKTVEDIIEGNHIAFIMEDYISQIIFNQYIDYGKSRENIKDMYDNFIKWITGKNSKNYPSFDSLIKFLNRNRYYIEMTDDGDYIRRIH